MPRLNVKFKNSAERSDLTFFFTSVSTCKFSWIGGNSDKLDG